MIRRAPMKRSAIKPSAKPLARSKPMKASGKRMKHGKVAPNAAESAWMAKVAAFGCIVCYRQGFGKVECAVHHIVEGGRRIGHLFTIGLCDPGHHQNAPVRSGEVSRHPTKARFESAYGTEYELLEFTQGLLA